MFFVSHTPLQLLTAHRSLPTDLKRLRKPKLNLSLVQAKIRRKRGVRVQSLRNQELRRIQQIAVVHGQRAAERRLHAKAQTCRMRPALAQVLRVDVVNKISRGHYWFRMEDIA